MIQNFYIVSNTGDLYFHKDYQQRKVNPSLLSGFISAINRFAGAIGEGEIKNMIISNQEWFYITKNDIIALCIADQTDSEEFINEFFLGPLIQKFQNTFENNLKEDLVELSSFEIFESDVNNQNEVYKKNAMESTTYVLSQAISLIGAIEIVGIDNLALMLRHAANHHLVIVGDELLTIKIAALIQGLIPVRVSSKLNKFTDLFVSTNYPDNNVVKIEFSTFNISNKGWTDQFYKKANYEKNLIKEISKKKGLGDTDIILVFRNKYTEFLDVVQEYLNVLWKFRDLPYLEKNLLQVVKDKTKSEFLHGNIKKKIGLDIDQIIRESKR